MSKSILHDGESCFLCGRQTGLEWHHILGGTANRKLSERYGLKVRLCHECHTGDGGAQYEKELNRELKQRAQRAFEMIYSHEEWMRRFRKNYLDLEVHDDAERANPEVA